MLSQCSFGLGWSQWYRTSIAPTALVYHINHSLEVSVPGSFHQTNFPESFSTGFRSVRQQKYWQFAYSHVVMQPLLLVLSRFIGCVMSFAARPCYQPRVSPHGVFGVCVMRLHDRTQSGSYVERHPITGTGVDLQPNRRSRQTSTIPCGTVLRVLSGSPRILLGFRSSCHRK